MPELRPMTAHVKESETAKILQLYAASVFWVHSFVCQLNWLCFYVFWKWPQAKQGLVGQIWSVCHHLTNPGPWALAYVHWSLVWWCQIIWNQKVSIVNYLWSPFLMSSTNRCKHIHPVKTVTMFLGIQILQLYLFRSKKYVGKNK